jgi:hypothetical protein
MATRFRWERPRGGSYNPPYIEPARSVLRSKYGSTCVDCGEPIKIGQPIRRSEAVPGWSHVECDRIKKSSPFRKSLYRDVIPSKLLIVGTEPLDFSHDRGCRLSIVFSRSQRGDGIGGPVSSIIH